MMKLSASLVLYNNDPEQFGQAIQDFLDGSDGCLVVIDNSPIRLCHPLFDHSRVQYEFTGENLGFGRAHNRALAIVNGGSQVHLLLNPDIAFAKQVLPHLLEYMDRNPDVGALMPRIEYPDGSLQRLCKLLPSPVDLMLRRFIPFAAIQLAINRRYELHDLRQDRPACVPSLSGCFLLVRTQILQDIGGFDERYFMYMEDVDLVRRIGDRWTTVYEPSVAVSHGYGKGSYRDRKLTNLHMKSALSYFFKWGWVLDGTRRRRNRAILRHVRDKSN